MRGTQWGRGYAGAVLWERCVTGHLRDLLCSLWALCVRFWTLRAIMVCVELRGVLLRVFPSTQVLVGLYEEPERPANAVDYIKRYLGAPAGV